jgi:hypothetical protein
VNGTSDGRIDEPVGTGRPKNPMGSVAIPRVRSRGRRRPWLLTLGVMVDVTVSKHDGPSLAARVATGRIAVVVEPRGD